MNSLYQAVLDKIRKITRPRAPRIPGTTSTLGLKRSPPTSPQPAPGSNVIPFAPGRIYKCAYTNYKHDPRPLIFIFSSNAFYTHGINIHYLGGLQQTMLRMIVYMRNSGKALTGMIMYQFLKQRAPRIPELGYRKYFTKYLKGKLVSDGVSQVPTPGKAEFLMEPFIRQLNKLIAPKVINKVTLTQQEAERLAGEMESAETTADQVTISRRGERSG